MNENASNCDRANALLQEVSRRGGLPTLSMNQRRVIVDAPVGALTRELREALVREKQVIIALLQKQQNEHQQDTGQWRQEPSQADGCQSSASQAQLAPSPPAQVHAGWLVAFRDASGRLRGGWDEPEHATVKEVRHTAGGCCLTLVDGTVLKERQVVSVAETDAAGRVLAAWRTARFGLTGQGTSERLE